MALQGNPPPPATPDVQDGRVLSLLPQEIAEGVDIPRGETPFGAVHAHRQILLDSFAQGWVDFLNFGNGLEGCYAEYCCLNDATLPVEGADLLKFHFKMLGNTTVHFTNGESATVRKGEMSVLIHPRGLRKYEKMTRLTSERAITLACRPGVLTRLLGLDPETLPAALRDFELGLAPAFFMNTMPLSSAARWALEEMVAAPYGGRFSHVHASLRAVDLVCAVLDALIETEQEGPAPLLARDERSLAAVRSHLSVCFRAPPTIAELARMAGMNRTKLTQGFRTLYRETVFEYCQRLRMNEARRMLLDGEPVGRVAAAVGYEHQSSFSQAYKAHFGFAPMASRRGRPGPRA